MTKSEISRPAWTMARFTGLNGDPVYIDLCQVAAITSAPRAGDLPPVALGARVVLFSGLALYTENGADDVFEEVRRARTAAPPPQEHIRNGDAPIGDTPHGDIARGPA